MQTHVISSRNHCCLEEVFSLQEFPLPMLMYVEHNYWSSAGRIIIYYDSTTSWEEQHRAGAWSCSSMQRSLVKYFNEKKSQQPGCKPRVTFHWAVHSRHFTALKVFHDDGNIVDGMSQAELFSSWGVLSESIFVSTFYLCLAFNPVLEEIPMTTS